MKSPRRSFLKMLGLGLLITRFAGAKFVAKSGATEPNWNSLVTKDGDFEWTAVRQYRIPHTVNITCGNGTHQSVTVTSSWTDRGQDVHRHDPSFDGGISWAAFPNDGLIAPVWKGGEE
jgi:hypothetical protein